MRWKTDAHIFHYITGTAGGRYTVVSVFGTGTPAAAVIKEASVEMLNVSLPSPPVPHKSIGRNQKDQWEREF